MILKNYVRKNNTHIIQWTLNFKSIKKTKLQ